MTHSNLKDHPDAEKHGKADYPVGKYRPPLEHCWKPGESGNPRGRPKGRRNLTTEAREIASKKVTVHDGETDKSLSLYGANLLTHAVKGAKGDARSAGLFLNHAHKLGLLGEEDSDLMADRPIPTEPADNARLGDPLFKDLEPERLSRAEKIELSRLTEIIELGGDFTALGDADFPRLKQIVNKGRGKDITPAVMSLNNDVPTEQRP
jgi:hypothetical protein